MVYFCTSPIHLADVNWATKMSLSPSTGCSVSCAAAAEPFDFGDLLQRGLQTLHHGGGIAGVDRRGR